MMALMLTKIPAPNALESIQNKVNVVIQENQDNVDLMDPLVSPEKPVMMPNAFLVNVVKMVNPEDPVDLEKMVHLGDLVMMVKMEKTLK